MFGFFNNRFIFIVCYANITVMSLIAPILNDIQLAAFDAIERGNKNLLILGQAGTGKSTFVNYLKSTSKKRVVCACPTAVSALNIGGQTYVALSRTRAATDMHIASPLRPRDVIFDNRVLEFVCSKES